MNNALDAQHGDDGLLLTAGGGPASDGRLGAKAHIAPVCGQIGRYTTTVLPGAFADCLCHGRESGAAMHNTPRTMEPPFTDVAGARPMASCTIAQEIKQ